MKNKYTEIVEKVVGHMKVAVSQNSKDVAISDYLLWLDFLKKIYPESALLKDTVDVLPQNLPVDNDFGKAVKQTSNILEIWMLAEEQQYPIWYIQPKFKEAAFVLEYEQGNIKNLSEHTTIPKTIEGFTGRISGQAHDKGFIAHDIDQENNFLKKMERLVNLHFTTPEFVLFPTDKLQKITSSKLETLFHNYVSQAQQQGFKVDGVMIVSDNQLFEVDKQTSGRRIAFTTV